MNPGSRETVRTTVGSLWSARERLKAEAYKGSDRMRNHFIKLALIIIFFSLMAACTHSRSMQSESGASDPLAAMIAFYQGPLNHLEAVRTGDCPMYPSCSEYGLQSIQKHGALIGWIMAMDRLMRCGRDETGLSQPVIVDGRLKYYDPLEKNDFWRSGR